MATAEILPQERLWAAMAFFAVLGVACFGALTSTLLAQPLFPFQLENRDWLKGDKYLRSMRNKLANPLLHDSEAEFSRRDRIAAWAANPHEEDESA